MGWMSLFRLADLSAAYNLQQAHRKLVKELDTLPVGATGSRNAPWNVPKVVMGVGLIAVAAGLFLSPWIIAAGGVLVVVGFLIAILSAVISLPK